MVLMEEALTTLEQICKSTAETYVNQDFEDVFGLHVKEVAWDPSKVQVQSSSKPHTN
jgi:hypothetical protein